MKAVQVATFLLVLIIFAGGKPIEKLVTHLTTKYDKEATLKVCKEIIALKPVYIDRSKSVWTSGCMWQSRNVSLKLNPDRQEEIMKIFKDKSSQIYDDIHAGCVNGSEYYEDEIKAGTMFTNSLIEEMGCDKL